MEGDPQALLNAAIFIDAARIYGLASGAHASNTAERFRLAAEAHRLHPDDVEKWICAFYFIQLLRLKNQQRSYHLGAGDAQSCRSDAA